MQEENKVLKRGIKSLMTKHNEEHQRSMQRESEIRKVQKDCEKRLTEADRQMKLFEKQK